MTTAKATYFATLDAGNFTYVFLLRNTSSVPYDVYALLIGAQFGVPLGAGVLQNLVAISAPQGWQLIPSTPYYGFLDGQTSFAGGAAASGYIVPNNVGTFVFQSSTSPPKTLPFGCCFWNGSNEWGFAFDGEAERVECVPLSEFPRPWRYAQNPPAYPRAVDATGIAGASSNTVKSHTLNVPDNGPSVTVAWDKFGNVVKVAVSRRTT